MADTCQYNTSIASHLYKSALFGIALLLEGAAAQGNQTAGPVEGGNYTQVAYPTGWTAARYIVIACQLVAAALAFGFIGTLLASDKARKTGFNVYLIFLALPDALLNFVVGFTELDGRLHVGDAGIRPVFCPLHLFTIFYYSCNVWLNAVVSYEIYTLVQQSYRARRVPPLALRRVNLQIAGVYVFSILLAVWSILEVPWSPWNLYNNSPEGRCELQPGSPGRPERGVFPGWAGAGIAGAIVLAPIVYVFYARIQIWRRNLLPVSGRTRALSMYFMRIVVVFFCFYIPGIVLTVAVIPQITNPTVRFWVWQLYFMLAPVQCVVTLAFAMTKKDVAEAVKKRFNVSCCHRIVDVIPRSAMRFTTAISTLRTSVFSTTSGPVPGEADEWEQEDVYLNNSNYSESANDDTKGNGAKANTISVDEGTNAVSSTQV